MSGARLCQIGARPARSPRGGMLFFYVGVEAAMDEIDEIDEIDEVWL